MGNQVKDVASVSSILDTKAEDFFADSEALQEGLRLGHVGVWRWKIGSDRLDWTRNLDSVHHLPPGSFDGTLATFQRDVHPDDAPKVWQKIRDSIETGGNYKTAYRTAPRPDLPTLWIETAGGIWVAPDGSKYLTGICLDITRRVTNELALKRRLKQQSAVAAFGSYALHEPNFAKVMDRAVQVAADVLDVPLTKILRFVDSADHLILCAGIGWTDGLVGQGQVGIERSSQAGYTLLVKEPVLVSDLLSETRFNGPTLLHDHGVRSGISVIIPGSDERPFGVFGIHATDLKEFDQTDAQFLQSLANIVAGAARQAVSHEHQRLLIREMAHRAGNLLQLVTSIARQTFSAKRDMRDAQKSFSERLGALAKSNYVVSRGGWTSTRFQVLAEEALRAFADRISPKGRDVLLPPDLCFDLGIVLHELATNSMKYGTLGNTEGKVNLTWQREIGPDGTHFFGLIWDDPHSGAGVEASGSGFGSVLMQALIEQKWQGKIDMRTDPNFRIGFRIPLA